jgi:hypothetical protein
MFVDFFYPDDGADTLLWIVGLYKTRTAPHPRRRHSPTIKVFKQSNTVEVLVCAVAVAGFVMCNLHNIYKLEEWCEVVALYLYDLLL